MPKIKQCLLHVGMNKTGSSSIQNTLSNKSFSQDIEYINIKKGPNQSSALWCMFSSEPYDYHKFRKFGYSRDIINEMRNDYRKKLSSMLERTRCERIIISAEAISMMDMAGTADLIEYLYKYVEEITVIAYVRMPDEFLASNFQQRLKSGDITEFNPEAAYARYRYRFEKFDKILGKEKVLLKLFSPDRFPNGCVVSDFCNWIDIKIPSNIIRRSNISLSKEAMGLLYAYRKHKPDYGIGPTAIDENQIIIDVLRSVGMTRFSFASNIVSAIFNHYIDDIKWMEARLGHPFPEYNSDNNTGISSENDLLDIDTNTCEEFLNEFKKNTKLDMIHLMDSMTDVSPGAVASAIHNCRLVYRDRLLEKYPATGILSARLWDKVKTMVKNT